MKIVIFWKEFHKEQFSDPSSFSLSLVKQAAFPSSATFSSLLAQDFRAVPHGQVPPDTLQAVLLQLFTA